jgi:hypothetical protein
MKDRLRLAQSIDQQVFEEIAIFYPFSRSPRGDSGGFEKRDSTADSVLPTSGFLGRRRDWKWHAATDLLEKGGRPLVVVRRP